MSNPDATDAVEALIVSYGNLVAEIRGLRSRVRDLDQEATEVDQVVARLRDIAVSIEQL
ncbi:hypothetical protein [Pseudomonas sp. KNUC1026]|uniref:hypothetical protein n=1 Tax=Pseudomonas sp. KNUC1026 TaxID=2893890 RepID=UPI001F3FFFEE|nr:hypothetical protein [Pseudomonas sp. KNUC1026]UFH51159.1 hypothetical protein LN139_09040 [Pseudomonas sp. KNUC1026]